MNVNVRRVPEKTLGCILECDHGGNGLVGSRAAEVFESWANIKEQKSIVGSDARDALSE
jgi:hypothetical protein